VTEAERRVCAMQIITAGMLHKLLKAEGNEAAELLIYDIKAASLARTFREINAWWTSRPPVPLENFSWFQGGIAKGAKIKGSLV
jgi:hypothetical protein